MTWHQTFNLWPTSLLNKGLIFSQIHYKTPPSHLHTILSPGISIKTWVRQYTRPIQTVLNQDTLPVHLCKFQNILIFIFLIIGDCSGIRGGTRINTVISFFEGDERNLTWYQSYKVLRLGEELWREDKWVKVIEFQSENTVTITVLNLNTFIKWQL